jgi:hypothetical protein
LPLEERNKREAIVNISIIASKDFISKGNLNWLVKKSKDLAFPEAAEYAKNLLDEREKSLAYYRELRERDDELCELIESEMELLTIREFSAEDADDPYDITDYITRDPDAT